MFVRVIGTTENINPVSLSKNTYPENYDICGYIYYPESIQQ